MQPIEIFALSLVATGLVLFGLGAKAVAQMLAGKEVGMAREFATWVLAIPVLLLGAGLVWLGARSFVPARWGDAGMIAVLAALCVSAAALPVRHALAKHRRPAGTVPSAGSVQGGATPASQAGSAATGASTGWPRPGLDAGIAAIRAVRQARADKLFRGIWIVALPSIAGAWLTYGTVAAMFAGCGSLILLALFYIPVEGINGVEYRTLPGAVDAHGKQRCVYCGWSGVYRHGAYASNSIWQQCTRCRKYLYVD